MAPSFQEGDVITIDEVNQLKPFLPEDFWDNRDFFFYEGMRLEIGPTQADYGPADVYKNATERFRGQPRIGPDNSLENYTAGQPFPMEEIDCLGDPQAGGPWAVRYRRRARRLRLRDAPSAARGRGPAGARPRWRVD